MGAAPPEDLRKAIAEGRCLIVCGAGVSQFATDGKAPGWAGLIRLGLQHATPRYGKKPHWVSACRALLESKRSEDWLYAADIIQAELGGHSSGKYRDFLKSAIGGMTCEKPEIIQAIDLLARNNKIATTNYDDLLIRGLGRPKCAWTETKDAAECLQGSFPAVLHLHGYWRDLASVVFSQRDYDRLRNDKNAQFLQQHASFNLVLLFVGCSISGLADKNIGALLEWFGVGWSGIGKTHYALVLNKDATKKWPSAVSPIPYGREYDDLPAYLQRLAAAGPSTPLKTRKPPPMLSLPSGMPSRRRASP